VAIQLALVPYQTTVDPTLVTRVAAALHRQVREHFGPLWAVDASVSAFLEWAAVPPDYARIILVDHVDSGALGVHADRNGQPYALVATSEDWSLVASHECLEMLADPSGRQTRRGPSPVADQGMVDFLVEVCDPCQGSRWQYRIDGVPVSDFCTPAYYQGSGAAHERWSYGGAIDGPRKVLKDGYLLWQTPDDHAWWRRDWLGAKLADYSLGPISPRVSFLRGHADRLWPARARGPKRQRPVVAKPSRQAREAARVLARDVDAALAVDVDASGAAVIVSGRAAPSPAPERRGRARRGGRRGGR
jgi:hypothetical protein